MLQRNVTGYDLVVQPPDSSHVEPFTLVAGDTVDYPDPITGCAAVPPAPAAEQPAAAEQTADGAAEPADAKPRRAAAKKTTDTSADGGDPA